MDNRYLILFRELTRSTEVLAERVMAYDKEKNDSKAEKTAQTMHDDFAKLYDKLSEKEFDPNTLTRVEWSKLLVAAMVVSRNLEDQIKGYQKALQGYKIDLVPKLSRIIDETKTDEEATTLANELFEISESK